MSTDNPSAFPLITPDMQVAGEPGMSLHTWQWTQFAANPPPIPAEFAAPKDSYDSYDESYRKAVKWAAIWACDYADAMMDEIAERAKPAPIPSTRP